MSSWTLIIGGCNIDKYKIASDDSASAQLYHGYILMPFISICWNIVQYDHYCRTATFETTLAFYLHEFEQFEIEFGVV